MASRVDVVIVGAGAAGLSAARSAASHRLSLVLVEVSLRIGGRAHTENFVPGQPFDLGCHWMHSASLNPFVDFATLSSSPHTPSGSCADVPRGYPPHIRARPMIQWSAGVTIEDMKRGVGKP